MSRKYLGKNINMFLLIVIIISVGSLVVVSTYYGQRYETISNDYRNIANKLENESQELIAAKNEIVLLKGNLNETKVDKSKYDELYQGKEAELASLSGDLQDTRTELVSMTNNYVSQKKLATDYKQERDNYKKSLDICEDDLLDCEGDLEDCENP